MVDKNLYGFYVSLLSGADVPRPRHGFGLGAAIPPHEEGVNSYREITEKEARKALQLSYVSVLNFRAFTTSISISA